MKKNLPLAAITFLAVAGLCIASAGALVSAHAQRRTLPYSIHVEALARYTTQRKPERRARAFVLEGIAAVDTDLYKSKYPVEVQRDGKKLQLYPGDELREGDRVRSLPYTGSTIFSGAFVAIYNDDGDPVLIIGHNRGVDFTLSKLRFDQQYYRAPRVEITNHSPIPPVVDMEIASLDPHGGIADIYKEDGTRERLPTEKEKDFLDLQMRQDDDHPHRREVRWIRARRIIKEGRAGAEQEYDVAEDEVTAENKRQGEYLQAAVEAGRKEKERELKEAGRDTSEKPSDQVSIAGAWTAGGINYEYAITQSGTTFSWQVTNQPSLNETAKGEFTGKDSIKATWTNRNGSASANGRITSDANGIAIRIDWSNGIVFTRM